MITMHHTRRYQALIILLLAFLSMPMAAFAGLCGDCSDRSYTKDIGSCSECQGMTSSGSFKICMGCSGKQNRCQHCLKPLVAPKPNTQPVALVVKVKVLAPERGNAPAEQWIREEMKRMQIPHGVGSGEQWHVLGKEPLTILNNNHFGKAFLALEATATDQPFKVVVTGTQPMVIELPRRAGERRLVAHTVETEQASRDLWYALSVEAE